MKKLALLALLLGLGLVVGCKKPEATGTTGTEATTPPSTEATTP